MSVRGPAWPMLIPILACVAVIVSRPAERFGASADGMPEVRWLIDDVDTAGRVLRGLNAHEGRLAGRTEEPDFIPPIEFGKQLQSVDRLEPRYLLEYPQGALLVFEGVVAAVPVSKHTEIPPAVLDARYHNLAHYVPQRQDEIILWGAFHRMAIVFNILFLICFLILMMLLRNGIGRDGTSSGPILLLALPASVYFAVHRYDILPVLMVILSIMAAVRHRCFVAGVCLGLAVMLKAYPLILAPILLRYLAKDTRTVGSFCIGMAIPIAGLFGSAVVTGDWTAALAPYRYQLTRPVEPESALFGSVLPLWLGGPGLAGLFRSGFVLAVVLLLSRKRVVSLDDLLARCGLAVLAFTAMQVFYSQQWLLWLTPLLVPLAAKDTKLFWYLVIFDLVNYLSFPIVYDQPRSPAIMFLQQLLLLSRFLMWILIAIRLIHVCRAATAAIDQHGT